MSAYSIIPSDATTYRAGMVNVQLGSPLKAARLHAAALLDGTQFVGDLPAQAESVPDVASRVDQARERKLVLGLEDRCPLFGIMLWQIVPRVCRKNAPGPQSARRGGACPYPYAGHAERGRADLLPRRP